MERVNLVWEFILKYWAANGLAPTYREIGEACEINSTSLVRYYLDRLQVAGKIERKPGVARGIIIKEGAHEPVAVD